ncbi:putative ribosome-binding factor A, mitochondrial [Hippopotamus amphibius kiboko]|uniref:putative ribosome-binding factor A, mitochondrial n=1 Tax=Hippopotamus amphibius kiboko TaxID=575201 RepID=UPI002592EA27|nr:putative ribosome-binding factor A, mitochondrial [Hippopotamus amphibius kiboko]
MWAALRGLWGLHAGLLLGGARGLHSSPVFCGKNLLKKFAAKTKKKFWYEGPSLGSHLTHKPSQLEFLVKSTSKRTRKEDHVRLRALNGLLYKALTDLLGTPEVSQELYDLNVELSKVSLTSDFSACRVFWRATLSEVQNTNTEAVLRRSAAHMRHILMSQQTLRNMPPIVFVRDRKNAAMVEVDRLLAIADFGPPDEKDFVQNDFRCDPEALDTVLPCDTLGPAAPSSLCGIDHEVLNKQILEYKRRRGKGHGSEGPGWPEHAAELTKQMRKSKAKPCKDRDLSPKDYLSGVGSDEPPGNGGALPEEHTPGYTWGLQEAGQEPEAERRDHEGRGA